MQAMYSEERKIVVVEMTALEAMVFADYLQAARDFPPPGTVEAALDSQERHDIYDLGGKLRTISEKHLPEDNIEF